MSRNKRVSTLGRSIMLGAGALIISAVLQATAFAAGTVNVSADKSSAGVSEQVTVSVATSEPEDPATPPQISITYNTDVLKFESCDVDYGGGEGGLVTLTGTGGNITFTTLAEGSGNISAEAIIDGDGNNPATASAQIAVGAAGGAAPEEGAAAAAPAGSTATLKALAIDPGVLSPAFTPDNTRYTITIADDVTDITVSGGPTDPAAQITLATGFKGLNPGENSEATIAVTGADGSTLEYHFDIVRGDVNAAQAALAAETTAAPETGDTQDGAAAADASSEDEGGLSAGFGLGNGFSKSEGDAMSILVGNNSFTIQPTIADGLMPAGGSKTTINYAGQSIEAVTLSGTGLTLVCAKSNIDGTEKLFLYDAASDSFQGFVIITAANGGFIIPVTLPASLPKGFVTEGTEIGGSYIACGKLKDSSVQQRENVCLLYATDQSGSTDYYLYDLSGGGYVHFLNTGASKGAATGFSKRAIAIIILLGVMLFLSLIIMLVMALKKGEDYTLLDEDEDDDDEPYEEEPRPVKRRPARPAPQQREAAPVKSAPVRKKRPVVREEDYDDEDYDDDYEQEPVRPAKRPVRRPARPVEEEDAGEDRSDMPEPTVRKVRKTRRVERPAYDPEDDSFDIDKEIAAMKENAVKNSATARMANVEQALRKQQNPRPAAPRSAAPSESADPTAPPVRRTVKSTRAREITPDNGARRPVQGTTRTVRPQTAEEAEMVRKPKVTKKVTEKGVTYTTGKIPITVVEAAKPADEAAKSSVPIFTLDEEAPAPAPAPAAEPAPAEIPAETAESAAAPESAD